MKNIKTLFVVSLLLLFNNIVFSQTTSDDANKNSSAQTTVNSAFENDVNYFSDTTSATGQTAASSNYKAPSTAGMSCWETMASSTLASWILICCC